MIKITKSHIGRKLYPIDNSYVKSLTSDNYFLPAGIRGNPREAVIIKSLPIRVSCFSFTKESEVREMVVVEYKGEDILVLNLFSEHSSS